jgi:hypothetical protein
MNGAQDLGGQHGFGPIEHDETGQNRYSTMSGKNAPLR